MIFTKISCRYPEVLFATLCCRLVMRKLMPMSSLSHVISTRVSKKHLEVTLNSCLFGETVGESS